MKLSIFGVGYVGLVSGACFAELGNNVICFDTDKNKIALLKRGIVPIYESGLKEILERNFKDGRIIFSDQPEEAGKFGDILFITVGTPQDNGGQPNLNYIYGAAKTIGQYLDKNQKIIVNKSTVPVGTAEEVKKIIAEELDKREVDFDFAVVSNPEFLKEGDAVRDFMKPDRIVVGVKEKWAKKKIEELYYPLVKNGHPIFFMDPLSSEMSKYAANAMLATKISFINQIANLCEITGADIEKVREAICSDKRIGHHFLYPGIGYGGSCLPKDVQALSALAKKLGYSASLLEAVERVNNEQKEYFANKIIREMSDINGKKIAVWGLSFKPHTDDMRCAPSLAIIEKLINQGAKISAYDPAAKNEAKKIIGRRINYSSDMYECLKGADALILLTEWPQFREPDFLKIKKLLNQPVIFDGRNIYSPSQMKDFGFKYVGIGRPKVC